MTGFDDLLCELRQQPFYRGQILRVRDLPGKPATGFALSSLYERLPQLRNGILERLFTVLGLDDLYANIVGGLERAFPATDRHGRDAVIVAAPSAARELFWQMTCFAEALDQGRLCVVLCRDADHLRGVRATLAATIRKADIEYAVTVAAVNETQDLSLFGHEVPMIVLVRPDTLRDLLLSSAVGAQAAKNMVLSALGRVIVPALDGWTPALATNTAFLLRQLHIECATRGVFPAFAGTISPVLNCPDYVTEFWGRPVRAEAYVREDSVESPPLCCINYGGTMLQESQGTDIWTREPIGRTAEDLLGWLVGKNALDQFAGVELHYVLDVSGSMDDKLVSVADAIVRDLKLRVESGSVKPGDKVKLSVFEENVKQVFPDSPEDPVPTDIEAFLAGFADRVHAQAAGGGTNLPLGLLAPVDAAMAGMSRAVDIILFSDGMSPILPSHRAKLLRLTRQACAEGRPIGLLYVVLDMAPPVEIQNLITEIGGRVVEETTAELASRQELLTGRLKREQETVVFLAGEKGLPATVTQPFGAGARTLVYTRDVTELTDPQQNRLVDPRSVVAVVVSGGFGSLGRITEQVQHLGWQSLPVFILSDAEAWAQVLCEDHPEIEDLGRVPLVWTTNPCAREARLREILAGAEIDAVLFDYLTEGAPAYMRMLARLGARGDDAGAGMAGAQRELPADYETVQREGRLVVRRLATDGERQGPPAPLGTFTADVVSVEGDGIRLHGDRASGGLLFHRGAIVDGADQSAEVESTTAGIVRLRALSLDRKVPLVAGTTVAPLDPSRMDRSAVTVERLGELSAGDVRFRGRVTGWRDYSRGNLDDRSTDVHPAQATDFDYQTVALRWLPAAAAIGARPGLQVTAGLANVLRLTLNGLFCRADQAVFVLPMDDAVWVIDLAVGGNGAAALLLRNHAVLRGLLACGGRILLECPCEGGLASSSTGTAIAPADNGCPRCARVVGPILVDADGADRFSRVSKRQTLDWLLAGQYLPGTGSMHIEEKYTGIEDRLRFTSAGSGSRRGIIALVRRILADRLGLTIDDGRLASFDWLPAGKKELGLYAPDSNTLAVQKGLREWFAMDVCAHEVFHNYQCRAPRLFDHGRLGEKATASLGWDGKLFSEGSAMWAASQVVDALAIRTCLSLASLRFGDEYGDGFRVMKYLEQREGGVQAVLRFLATGDVAAATGGRVKSIDDLLAKAEVSPE